MVYGIKVVCGKIAIVSGNSNSVCYGGGMGGSSSGA